MWLKREAALLPLKQRQEPLLFCLPQKIQCCIFDYAYPRDVNLFLITKSAWYTRADPTIPFPPEKVCAFLVSKEFFHSAAKAWTGNQIFSDTAFLAEIQANGAGRGGIIASFAQTFHLQHTSSLPTLRAFPCPQTLFITINPSDLAQSRPKKSPWTHLYFRDDLERSEIFVRLLYSCHGVPPKKVILLGTECEEAETWFQGHVWRENVKNLEKIIGERIEEDGIALRRFREERGERREEDGLRRLYHGSEVCVDWVREHWDGWDKRHDSLGCVVLQGKDDGKRPDEKCLGDLGNLLDPAGAGGPSLMHRKARSLLAARRDDEATTLVGLPTPLFLARKTMCLYEAEDYSPSAANQPPTSSVTATEHDSGDEKKIKPEKRPDLLGVSTVVGLFCIVCIATLRSSAAK